MNYRIQATPEFLVLRSVEYHSPLIDRRFLRWMNYIFSNYVLGGGGALICIYLSVEPNSSVDLCSCPALSVGCATCSYLECWL